MLYYSMSHRTQLYLDDDQHRWLRARAREAGSIAAVVRQLIDQARRTPLEDDSLIHYLTEAPPAAAAEPSSVTDLDRDLYGR